MPKRSQHTVKALQEQAQALFNKGCSQSEVAKILGCSIRTLQRWKLKVTVDHLSEKSPLEQNPDLREKAIGMLESGTQPGDVAKELTSKIQSTIVAAIPDPPGWHHEKQAMMQETQKLHREISWKLASILHSHLDEDPVNVNVRAVDRLSQALTRHTNAARDSLDCRWSDGNKALSLLAAYGYSVINLGEISEKMKEEKAKLDSPHHHPLNSDSV